MAKFDIDVELAALEAALCGEEPATESLLNRKKTVEQLLAVAAKRIPGKVKTVEACEARLAAVNAEAKKFDDALRAMADAAKKVSEGKLEKKEAQKIIAEESKKIKDAAKLLQITLGNVVENRNSVTSEELADFKKYVAGFKKLLQEHLKTLKAAAKPATEAACEEDEDCEDPKSSKGDEDGDEDGEGEDDGDGDEGEDDEEEDEEEDAEESARFAQFATECTSLLIEDEVEPATESSFDKEILEFLGL